MNPEIIRERNYDNSIKENLIERNINKPNLTKRSDLLIGDIFSDNEIGMSRKYYLKITRETKKRWYYKILKKDEEKRGLFLDSITYEIFSRDGELCGKERFIKKGDAKYILDREQEKFYSSYL